MSATFSNTFSRGLLASALALAMSGCIDSSTTDSGTASTTVTGSAVAGAVTGSVTVLNAAGEEVASGAVSDGSFSVDVPDAALGENLRFVVTGSYADEVSGNTVNLSDASPLALFVAADYFQAGGSGYAPVSPSSTVIHQLVLEHGMTLEQAQTSFKAAFGYLPDMTARPFDPSLVDEATAAARPRVDQDAAFRAGSLSQLANDLGLSGDDIAAMLNGLADDLADGALDGVDDSGAAVMIGSVNLQRMHETSPLDTRLVQAYGAFAGSSANAAGLAAPSMGLPSMSFDAPGTTKQVMLADGRVLNVTLETNASTPFMDGFWTARVKHKITLKDSADGSAVDVASDSSIKGLGQSPHMYMITGHDHGAPYAEMADTSLAASGIYQLDTYYLMASEMGMGEMAMPMGVWEYTVKIEQDTDADGTADTTANVVFYPQVKMQMDGSVMYAKLSNNNHLWTNMMGMSEPREYRVWLHDVSINADSSHDVSVFVSTQDVADMAMSSTTTMTRMDMSGQGMMRFPAAYSGQTLNGPVNAMGMRPEITLASVTVDVSTDGGTSWITMNEGSNNAVFSATGLSGLTAGELNTLTFRLTVNDGTHSAVMTTAAGSDAQLVFVAPSS